MGFLKELINSIKFTFGSREEQAKMIDEKKNKDLQNLLKKGELTKDKVNDYYEFGWITEEQADEYKKILRREESAELSKTNGFNSLNLTQNSTAYVPPSTLTGTGTSTPTPTPTPTPEVPDTTDQNVSTTINPSGYITAEEWFKWLEEDRTARWERDDAIRAETQAREDNAWQRGVRDMQLAGINPNLINATPAASGGGITNSSGIDYSGLMAEQAAKYGADVQSEIAAMDRQFQKETIEMGQKFELLLQENSYNRQEALEAMKAENELYLQEYLQKWKEELLKYEVITENEYKIALQEDAQLSSEEQGKKNRIMNYILGFCSIIGVIAKAFI